MKPELEMVSTTRSSYRTTIIVGLNCLIKQTWSKSRLEWRRPSNDDDTCRIFFLISTFLDQKASAETRPGIICTCTLHFDSPLVGQVLSTQYSSDVLCIKVMYLMALVSFSPCHKFLFFLITQINWPVIYLFIYLIPSSCEIQCFLIHRIGTTFCEKGNLHQLQLNCHKVWNFQYLNKR